MISDYQISVVKYNGCYTMKKVSFIIILKKMKINNSIIVQPIYILTSN